MAQNSAETNKISTDSCVTQYFVAKVSSDPLNVSPKDSLVQLACYRNRVLHGEQITLSPSGDTSVVSHYFMGIQHGAYTSFYPSSQVKISSNYLLGELEGSYTRYYSNGNLAAKGRYQDGKPHGYWENYYPNGALASQGKLFLGKSSGTWRFFHPNGKLKQTELWKDFILVELSPFYTPEGSAKNIGDYQNGQGNIIWYRDNGTMKEKASYYKGLKQGRAQLFNEKETKVEEYFYQRDTLHGPYFKYHGNGTLSETGFFVKGIVEGAFHRYDSAAQLQQKGIFKNSKKEQLWYTYHPSGTVRAQVVYSDNIKEGEAIVFDEAGNVSQRGRYLNNEKEGVWKRFFPNQNIRRIENYKHGLLEGDFVEYLESGALAVKGSYHQHKKEGRWEYYQLATTVAFLFSEDESRFVLNRKKKTKAATTTPLLVGHFKNGLKEGAWEYKYAQGKPLQTETWKNGQLIKVSAQLLPNGKKCKSGKIENGNGRRTFYDANGKKYLEGFYQKGIPSGIWKYYDRKENLMRQVVM